MLLIKDVKLKKEEAGEAKGGGNGGRRRGVNRRFQGQRGASINAASKLKGDTEELHENVYDCDVANQSKLFTATTKKVANYAL